ncbi:uncharacterized protein LOC109510728 [Hippocampus comes]|uniref:uncharacterized protein LOC109510728 n=1 Tax=Hippocampus comes TaxID=109280 RepID=UPI00094E0E08|nr:PREDICTED: uncharacterized protein LOC109510728 [Hippocampus comes]
MRLTWSTMLQHNNNNNYPCLKASPRETPLKCSSTSQPFPSRLELGLADLPLIRGLRAWALCSKNRQKSGTTPSGGRAPVSPPTGRRTCCRPRPADVHSSGAWDSGYGLPQAAEGTLVTVATLKTSEGNGKTQTQCLFLRNDKGSCLYSTSGGTSGGGGWLRGKSVSGTGRRDVSALQTQTAPSRVRVRSGRRWRKSTHPIGREKRHPDEEVTKKQEKQSKAGLQRLTSPKEEVCQEHRGLRGSPECLQNLSNEGRTRKSMYTDTQDNKTLPEEEVKVEQEEPHKVCQDCVVSQEGEASQKSRGSRGSPDYHENPSNAESQRKSSHAAGRVKRLPEEEVAEKEEETHKVELQRITSPDEGQKSCGPGGTPGCLQNASNEASIGKSSHVASQGKRLPDEDVTEKQERGNKLDLACRVSPHERASSKRRGLVGSPQSFLNAFSVDSERKSSHVACRDKRLADEEVTEKQEEPDKVSSEGVASHKGGLCQESPELGRSLGCLQKLSKEENARKEGSLRREITETRREWEENAEEGEEGNGLCQNDPSILLAANPDLESSHSHLKCQRGKDSINIRKRRDEAQHAIQAPFDDITSRCTEEPYPAGGSTGQAEGEVGRALRSSGAHSEPEHNVTNTTRASSSFSSFSRKNFRVDCEKGKEADWMPTEFACGFMVTPAGPCLHNSNPTQPDLGTMATSQNCTKAEEVEKRGQDRIELESRDVKQEEDWDEEDEFGGFVQAEGGEEGSQGIAVSVPVHCGSSAAFESSDLSGELCDWKPTWMGNADAWAAFPQDVGDEGRDLVGQWWPEEASTDRVCHELGLLFVTAFPSVPNSAPRHPADIIPTLTQLLAGSSSHEKRLLDGFHDISKMSVHKYKRGGGGVSMSRGLLLSSLHMEQPNNESRAVHQWLNRRPSPGLLSPNRYAHNAVAKRRLSCDYNRSSLA